MRGAPLGLRGHAWVSWPITLQECAENNLFTGHVYFYRTVTLVSPPPACGRALGIRKGKHISRCEPSLHPESGVSFGRTPAQPDALAQQRVPTHLVPLHLS